MKFSPTVPALHFSPALPINKKQVSEAAPSVKQ
jgi:hypothetical protein